MLRKFLLVLLALGLGACGGGAKMNTVGEPPVIRQGESTVVFMRASQLGGLVAASVFDVTGPETKFVGLVGFGTKLAHAVQPGQYTFMVMGESADFMQATVLAGRTYYALVTPRMGVWKARFSFRPVRQHELGGAEFAGWDSATPQYVANSPETLAWAAQNAADIESKRSQYWPEWASKPAEQRASQTLMAEDGKAVAGAAPLAAAPASSSSSEKLPVAQRVETVFWESIRASNDPSDFRAYLEQYPNGAFAVLARNRVAALERKPAAAAPAQQASVPSQKPCSGPPGAPCVGDTWTYRVTMPRTGQRGTQQITLASFAPDSIVEEILGSEGVKQRAEHRKGHYLAPAGALTVFSPYLEAFGSPPAGPLRGIDNLDARTCKAGWTCSVRGSVTGRERIQVPAGSFETIRVNISQSWMSQSQTNDRGESVSRTLTVWYAPEAKRAVRVTSRGAPSAFVETEYDLELVNYTVK